MRQAQELKEKEKHTTIMHFEMLMPQYYHFYVKDRSGMVEVVVQNMMIPCHGGGWGCSEQCFVKG